MSTVTTRALPTCVFVVLALLIGPIAPCPNVAAADLPQHIPVQGFDPVAADFAGVFSNEAQFGHAVAIRNGTAFMGIPLAQEFTGRVAVFTQTVPFRMNDRGTIVVGNARGEGRTVPVIWQNGTIMPLSPPPGFSVAGTRDVNDRGMVLLVPPYTWQAGNLTRLNPLVGLQQNHIALRLNNQGVVAGYTGTVATLWLEGHGRDLNRLISGTDPLTPFVSSLQAHFINDHNQVLVVGQDSRNPGLGYYLLSPVDLEE